MDEYGHFSPFNDDINYPAMNSNALISIFHVSSHDIAVAADIRCPYQDDRDYEHTRLNPR